jgi:hypothetical protein
VALPMGAWTTGSSMPSRSHSGVDSDHVIYQAARDTCPALVNGGPG